MSENQKVQEQLEAIVGYPLDEHSLHSIALTQIVASRIEAPASITSRSLFLARPNRCAQGTVIDVKGLAQTGADGTVTFRLKSFLCPNGEIFQLPLNVVATALGVNPRYVTVSRKLVDDGADVEIEVRSWGPDGAPAQTVFDWRCSVQLVPLFP